MDTNKLIAYESRKANPTTVWLLFLFLGWSYGSLDKIGLQILFYITLGGFGIWTLFRLFTLNGAIKTYNRIIAEQAGLNNQEMATLNLL
ncbi:TM2 domain-containing protein [Tenacibaculum finnmarkense]|uniref:TM2 domain-containing protein n=1 Tax=Tenacibaculum finnmarkense TaxID=2781243 RepID=UPI001EFBB618|nr:TM2 domain-containing protein [Tenacibaculum finnmarkense]MCG8881790.1 TM2 domain-containing protein [Tenacibaculum finnmarkense]